MSIPDFRVVVAIDFGTTTSPEAIGILQDCILKAGYTTKNSKNNLEFTTEPEAAALYCMEKLEELRLSEGSTFMVVDCGGGTVDLTVRKLLSKNKLSEITERSGDLCEEMEQEDWLLEIKYEDVRKMFDPVIEKVIRLIRNQLTSSKEKCSAMFIVGGFAESPYLVSKVKETFNSAVPIICVPQNPISAVLRGGVIYGLNKKTIATRQLKLNYGVQVYPLWKKGVDPKKRMTAEGPQNKNTERIYTAEFKYTIPDFYFGPATR
nr:14489_t:CDS:10 [Entrophospora candida]